MNSSSLSEVVLTQRVNLAERNGVNLSERYRQADASPGQQPFGGRISGRKPDVWRHFYYVFVPPVCRSDFVYVAWLLPPFLQPSPVEICAHVRTGRLISLFVEETT